MIRSHVGGHGPLFGLRVLDLTDGIAGPVAGMLLGDLDADVLKVYKPDTLVSPERPGLHVWDRNKSGALLDPGQLDDLAVLDQMVERADVVLLGTTDEDLGYHALLARGQKPGHSAAWVVLPPYLLGETPWEVGAESGTLLFSYLGHAWSQASHEDVPVDCVYPVSLYMQGIWAAATAIALQVGARRGRRAGALAVAGGAHGGVMVSPGAFVAERDEPHAHRPGGPGGSLPNYRCYRCAEGGWIFFGAFTTAFIERGFNALGLGHLLGDTRIARDPARVRLPEHSEWLTCELEETFRQRASDEWIKLLEAADVPVSTIEWTADWLEHEQVRAMGLRAELSTAFGETVVMPGPLMDLSATPASVRRAAPAEPPPLADVMGYWTPRQVDPSARNAAEELPLTGFKVLNLGTIIAGPYAATLLGELGAEVVKVERPPTGDEYRIAHGGRGGAGFSVFNRDQRSILIDLTAEEGRATLLALAGASDVVVENYRPGVVARLGITHEDLAAVNPLITSLSISAFGGKGPLGHRPGFDPVVQAMSGIMRAQGGADEEFSPAFLTVPINDVLAAGLGAVGVCASLYVRSALNRGQHVEVTLCASSCLLQSEQLVRAPSLLPVPPQGGRDFPGPSPLDRLYRTLDGWVRVACRMPGDAQRLEEIGFPISDANEFASIFAKLPVAEVIRLFRVAGVAAAPVRQPGELVKDVSLLDSGLLTLLDGTREDPASVGPGRLVSLPGLSQDPPGEAPHAGEHALSILVEHGFETEEIDTLVTSGVVSGVRTL